MNKKSSLSQLANCLFYLTIQVALARFMVLSHTAFCFVYVAFLLLFPRRKEGLPLLLLISFVVGLLVDMFYNSMGIHAFASVLMVYSRALLLKLMLSASSYETAIQPTLSNLGWKRFSFFALLLIGIHHTALLLLDTGAALSSVIIRKAVLSTLLTYIAVLITQIPTALVDRR